MAVVARARERTAGVVVCVLVEGRYLARVEVAEDVAAAAAVVAAREVTEGSLAGWVVAYR